MPTTEPGRIQRDLVVSLLLSPWMWLAGFSAVILLTAFVAAIRDYPLSLTYTAVTASAMVILTGLGAGLQYEQVSVMRGAGLALIIAGLLLTARAG